MTKMLEGDAFDKYSNSAVYNETTITRSLEVSPIDWGTTLLAIKAETLKGLVGANRVLDIGCANGRHLAELSEFIASGTGVDFSPRFIEAAERDYKSNAKLSFLVADARSIPLPSASFEAIYSFATLYYVDEIDKVYAEIERLLVPGGFTVLEVGNAKSLATRVSSRKENAQLAQHSRRTIGDHLEALARSNLKIVSHRAFQILPMWGNLPGLLAWTRMPALDKLMAKSVGGRMIDEWVSSAPGLNRLAFRHLLVAQKAG
jgi:SAM-dependent methyltransferase